LIGFAAETDDVVANAIAKRAAKARLDHRNECQAMSWRRQEQNHLISESGTETPW